MRATQSTATPTAQLEPNSLGEPPRPVGGDTPRVRHLRDEGEAAPPAGRRREGRLGFEDIDGALEFRMARQRILTRDAPPRIHAVIHEAALHMRFGGAKVVRAQLLRLIELGRLPNVTIQIYPFSAQAYAALSGNFVHVTPSVPELGTVILEQPTGLQYLTERDPLRESDDPGTILTTAPAQLAALLHHLKRPLRGR